VKRRLFTLASAVSAIVLIATAATFVYTRDSPPIYLYFGTRRRYLIVAYFRSVELWDRGWKLADLGLPPIALGAAVLPICWLVWLWRSRIGRLIQKIRLRHFARHGLCPTCGYDLRATPNRCPECGTVPSSPNPAG